MPARAELILLERELIVPTLETVARDTGLSIVQHDLHVPPSTEAQPNPVLLASQDMIVLRDSYWKGKTYTTGNHMMDCLALWYGPQLDDETIATFRTLDTRVRDAIGELALVVLRGEEYDHHRSIVGAQYQVSRLTDDVGLYMELNAAQVKLPTEGSNRVMTLLSGEPGIVELPSYHPMIVHNMFDLSARILSPKLLLHSIDLLNHQEQPTIDPDRTDPPICIDPDHVLEAQKPPLEIIIGTELVKGFLETDPALQRHGDAMGISVASFLLRNFE